MDKVPDRAAVSESVDIRAKGQAQYTGFINGILRSISRKSTLRSLIRKKPCEFLSLQYTPILV